MQSIHGDSLKALANGKPLPLEQVLDAGCQIAAALEAVHAKGTVHGDVTPANVIVTNGQASLLPPGGPSINYRSPEQVRGQALDARSDLFSLGLVLYEMTTGRQAFSGPTAEAVSDAILNRDPVPVREVNPAVPTELDHVITRALEKDRKMRYQTAAEMRSELTRLGRTAAPVPSAPPATRKLNPLFIAVPVLAILAVAAWLFWRSAQPPGFTERDTIVIADFENTTGDPVFDEGPRQA